MHPQYWLAEDYHREQEKVSRQLERLREDIDAIGSRLTLILGGIALLAFLAPILSPLFRAWLNIDLPAGQ